MNILIVLTTDSLGGAEQYLKMIATYYKGEDISIYYFKNNKRGHWDDVEPFAKKYLISTVHEVTGIIGFVFMMLFNRKRYDHIYTSHIYTTALVGMLKSLGIIRSKYFIARESTSIFLRFKGFILAFYSFLYKIGYKKMDLLICQTVEMKNQLLDHFPKIVNRTTIKVIPNPIDLNGKAELANETLDQIFKENCIVSAGRLIELKGYNFLIGAFESLKKEYPELKLVILGRGPLKEVIEEQVGQSKYKEDIFLRGRVDNVYNYFKNARICVVSSLIEGFPNVLLQMMSQNEKVVCTLCAGGIKEIQGVYKCEPGSSGTLAEAMNKCLTDNTEKNRDIFDACLETRSLTSFIQNINNTIQSLK